MANAELMSTIRSRLRDAADPARAAGAQAYLKSGMPSLGVRVPEVRRIVKAAAKELPPRSLQDLQSTVLELWRGADCREERYAAIDLTGLRLAAGELDMLPVYEEIIRTGAWWDLVDGGLAPALRVAAHPPGGHVPHPEALDARTRTFGSGGPPSRHSWARNPLRDPALLAAVIEPNLADREFFIRKAIGWALRDYAATDPDCGPGIRTARAAGR